MASEQFSLCWDNFHKNISAGMQSLLENEDLVDVTLAVEGRYLKAHKVVLSICSPYFRELFQTTPCKHPIMYMRDVSYLAMSDLLQFMYQGEVQVAQENLTTFIKTAESLQIKGLTGDGTNQDSDSVEPAEVERVAIEAPVKRPHETTTITKPAPISRVKKPAGPASKRSRFSMPVSEFSNANPTASSTPAATKSEAAGATSSEVDMVNLKMEPSESSDQAQVEEADDSQAEKYGDDSNIDDGHDDTEDYSLIETNDDEPKAGTSADGTSDGQDGKLSVNKGKKCKRRINTRMRFVVDGFVYHNNLIAGIPPLRYLGCAEHRRAGCRGRATLPLNGTLNQLKITQQHNHPPDITAGEKDAFVKELKKAVRSMENSTLKRVYEAVSQMYIELRYAE